MGNEASSNETAEDQHSDQREQDAEGGSYITATTDGSIKLQASQAAIVENHVVGIDVVDRSKNLKQENTVAPSSQKTTETSPITDADGKNLGKDASKAMPAAKSRFSLSFSRTVPSRTEHQDTDSSLGPSTAEANSGHPTVNKASTEQGKLPDLSAQKGSSDKKQDQAHSQASLSLAEQPHLAKIPEVDETSPKPKQTSFFDTLFKGKEKEKSKQNTQQELMSSESPPPSKETAELQNKLNNVQKSKLDASNTDPITPTVSASVSLSPGGEVSFNKDSKESGKNKQPDSTKTQTPTEQSSVMSLFKSFSKSKEVSAKDSEAEQKSSTEEKGQSKTAKEDSQANGSKELENPTKEKEEKESGQRPFGKLFKSKSIKEPADSAVDGKSEKETPLSQAVETAKQDAKNIVVAVQQEVVAQLEPQNELSKAKEMDAPSNQKSKEPGQSPFSKLFKSKDGPESATATVDVKSPNVESTSNALSPAKEGSKHSDPSEKEKLAEESKPAKSGLMSFFKQLSIKEEVLNTNSVEINGKEPETEKLDITDGKGNKRAEAAEKTDVSSTTESSPSIQKGKDKSKDKKKAAAEQNKEKDNKQEVKQAQETPTAAQLQNAVTEPTTDSEDKDAKKAEKKSFGDFFKALSVKKTCDAEVQTDLVTILPAEK